jgi:hypothetical protein
MINETVGKKLSDTIGTVSAHYNEMRYEINFLKDRFSEFEDGIGGKIIELEDKSKNPQKKIIYRMNRTGGNAYWDSDPRNKTRQQEAKGRKSYSNRNFYSSKRGNERQLRQAHEATKEERKTEKEVTKGQHAEENPKENGRLEINPKPSFFPFPQLGFPGYSATFPPPHNLPCLPTTPIPTSNWGKTILYLLLSRNQRSGQMSASYLGMHNR